MPMTRGLSLRVRIDSPELILRIDGCRGGSRLSSSEHALSPVNSPVSALKAKSV
jgi:hypothetical protein